MACWGIDHHQLFIFALGWVGYAVTYFLRKPLGVVKGDMQAELKFTASQLGWMDMALILPYAIFQMTLGSLGDRLGAGFTFGVCLILDGAVMWTFGWWSSLHIFLFLLFLNGTCQSICWPNATKVLSTWFPTGGSRGTMFGLFGTSAFVGGFLGTALIVYLQTTYDWRAAFTIPSIIVMLTGVLVVLFYKEVPATVRSTDALQKTDSMSHSSTSWISLCSLRLVPEVAVSALCIKVVRYAFYGWLPLYLYQHLNYTKGQAGMFSTMFDIGGVFGSAFIGVFINKFFNGRALHGCMVGILISTLSLGLFMATAGWGMTINSILLFLAGAFNCGPDTILVSLVPADIGNRDGRNAAAAVTGLVNGFGSLGSVVQGPLVGFILGVSGWNAVLLFIVLTSAVGTAVALRAALRDTAALHTPANNQVEGV